MPFYILSSYPVTSFFTSTTVSFCVNSPLILFFSQSSLVNPQRFFTSLPSLLILGSISLTVCLSLSSLFLLCFTFILLHPCPSSFLFPFIFLGTTIASHSILTILIPPYLSFLSLPVSFFYNLLVLYLFFYLCFSYSFLQQMLLQSASVFVCYYAGL